MNQLRKLAEPIDQRFIGKSGKGMDAADHTVIRQLLLLHLGPHDWEIDEVIYSDMPDFETSKGDVHKGGRMVTGCIGRLTVTIDGRRVTVREPGGVDMAQMKDGDGERLKHAASDALKRCAMSLGLGLHIWAQNMYFLNVSLDKREAANQEPDPAEDVGGGPDVPEKKEGDETDRSNLSRGDKQEPAPTDQPDTRDALRKKYFAILAGLAKDNVGNAAYINDWKDLAHTIVKRQYQVDSTNDIPDADFNKFVDALDNNTNDVRKRFVGKVNDEWQARQEAAADPDEDEVTRIREEMRAKFGTGSGDAA